MSQQLPIHHSIMVVDVERYSDPARTNLNQLAVRDALYEALMQAFGKSGIAWEHCVSEDRGDGALILVPPDVPKTRLLTGLPGILAAAVSRHNAECAQPERMRLRVAMHAGEIYRDAHGVAGTAINHAFRLVEAPVLKSALDESPGMLAVIISDWLFTEVAKHDPAAEPDSYQQVQVSVKETETAGWIRVPDPDATPANASQDDDPLLQEVTASDARQTVGLAALGMAGTGDSAPVKQDLFSGKFERLRDVCFDPAPLVRDLDLARFTGREWLIRQIDAFIQRRPRGYVIIQAEAGVGKSTLAAHLAGTRPWPCHFTRLPGGRSPEAARKSLAAQMIAGWDLPKWAPDGTLPVASSRPDWFSRLLEAAARKRDQQRPEEALREPIVMVVDGLDEAEPEAAGGRGLPLGLPESLPDGVYVVATSRFGIDRALHAVRNPADWLQIDVEGTGNLDDMRRFIQDVTSPERGDQRLMEMLDGAGVDVGWFRANVAQACAGVWIYLRYVLDEIRDGIRNPRSVGDLPGDLAGFYAEQIERWRGAAEDETAHRRWEQVRLPLLGVLGAARTPLTEAELAEFTRMPSTEAARVFVEETARAFLSCRDDDPPGSPKDASRHGSPKYALRHQSLRDLLTGNIPVRPDLQNAARMLTAQVQAAHRQITSVLTPDGEPGERAWDTVRPYARQHLPAHAAACGELDFLASDPGFLLAADPGAVLAQRANLRTADGKRALAAFDLSLHDWEAATSATRLDRLAANAARVHATALAAACVIAGGEWPVRWAAWTGQGHRRLARHGSVRAVAIGRAGDHEVIVSGSDDQTVRVWDAVTGAPVGGPLVGHDGPVRAVAIGRARDREVIVSGSDDQTVRVWDAVTGAPVGGPLAGHDGPVRAVAIGRAGDHEVIVSGSDDQTVRVWDAVTGAPVGGPLAGHEFWVRAVALGRAGDREVIVSGSADGTVRVWDAVTGAPVGAPLAGHRGPVTSVAIGRAGDRDVIVSGSADRTVRVWDAVTGAPVGGPLAGHEFWVISVALGRAGDREVIVSGSDDQTVRVWDAVTGAPVGAPLAGHEFYVNAVAIGRAGYRDVIVSGSADRTVRVWDAVTGAPLAGHDGPVTSVAIGQARDRDVIVSGSDDKTVRVWDAVTGAPVGAPLAGHHDWVTSVAIGQAGDREVIVSGSDDQTVRVWDAVTGAPVGAPLAGHDGPVTSVAIGQAGDRDVIVSGSDDQTVRVWDAVTGAPVGAPLAGHHDSVTSVAIGQAGDRNVIVSGSDDQTVRVWDAVTGAPVGAPLAGHELWVRAVAIGQAGDRNVIVSGSADQTVRVWDAVTGAPVGAPLAGHHGPVTSVAIGQAGDREVIVSGSDDGTVRVWDAVTGAPVGAPLAGHDDWVTSVAIGQAGDCEVIVSGSDDRTVLTRQPRPRRQVLRITQPPGSAGGAANRARSRDAPPSRCRSACSLPRPAPLPGWRADHLDRVLPARNRQGGCG